MEKELEPIKDIIDTTIAPKVKALEGIPRHSGKKMSNPNIGKLAKMGGLAKAGVKHKTTLAKEEALLQYEQKMIDNLYAITRAQLTIALGSQYLYKIEKKKVKKDYFEKKAVLVTDRWEIEQFLNDYINDVHDTDPGATYYFLTTKDPDTRAITDILDRVGGKPTQKVINVNLNKNLDNPAVQSNPEIVKLLKDFHTNIRKTLIYGKSNN